MSGFNKIMKILILFLSCRWNSILAGVRNDQDVLDRSGWHLLPPSALGLNVLMFGFDSLSRNTFIRKLPRSYSFLKNQLDAVVMGGYNIVGDGTPQALIPILTGKSNHHCSFWPLVMFKSFKPSGRLIYIKLQFCVTNSHFYC